MVSLSYLGDEMDGRADADIAGAATEIARQRNFLTTLRTFLLTTFCVYATKAGNQSLGAGGAAGTMRFALSIKANAVHDEMRARWAGGAFWRDEPALQKHNSRRVEVAGPRPFTRGPVFFPVIYRAGLCCTRRRCSVSACSCGTKKPAAGVFSRAAPWTSLPRLEPFANASKDSGRRAGARRSRPTPHPKGDTPPWLELTST
jgi:hypothetical protein